MLVQCRHVGLRLVSEQAVVVGAGVGLVCFDSCALLLSRPAVMLPMMSVWSSAHRLFALRAIVFLVGLWHEVLVCSEA